MPTNDLEKKNICNKQDLRAICSPAFASGLFPGDVTVSTLLESFAEGVVIIDHAGIILLVNSSAEQMFGYPQKEIIGTHVSCLYSEEVRKAGKPEEELEKATLMGRVAYEGWRIRKDGSRLWADVSITALRDESGKLQGFTRVTHDITEHKKVEEALRISGDRYRAMISSNPAMITTLAADLTMLSVNPFFASLLGYTIKELEGQSILQIFYEDDRPVVAEQLQSCLQNPEQVNRWRFRKIRKDGGLVWVEEIAQAVRDQNGALNILVVCQDVTERKRMEEEIGRLNSDLAARAAELEAVNRELEAFNYTVAHDLRKPLTVVYGYCQLIETMCNNQLDAQCKGYLGEVCDASTRMNRLIDALLEFSCVAHVELRRERVDLSSIVQEVAAELAQAEPTRRVKFLIREGISVSADASLLRVALENLLGNAWKYTGMQEEGVIEFATTEVEGKPVYFIRDNGAGFDMTVADKLFAPFQRLPGAEAADGHGIGLSTVERIISRHGGRVWAEGEAGKGATFYFTLAAD